MKRSEPRITPSFIVSCIALFVALSGGAYAALDKATVGPAQLKRGAVVTKKIRNRSVTTSKLKSGSVTKSKIATNALGPRIVAYATINGEGKLVPARSRGLSQRNISGGDPFPICLSKLPAFSTATVTPMSANSLHVVTASLRFDDVYCPESPKAQIQIDTWIEDRFDSGAEQLPYPSQQAFTLVLFK